MRGAALVATTAATGLLYRKLNQAPAKTPKGEKLVSVAKLQTSSGSPGLYHRRKANAY